MGDLLQLPPVNGRPVFQNVSSTIVKQRLGSGCAINIWKETVEYDELTINERQKGDQEFFAMLDCLHRGCTTEVTLGTLRKRLIDVSIEETVWELSKQGKSPVCLFAKRTSCQEVNIRMLAGLPSEKVELPCTDVADDGASSNKFNKKAAEQKKLSVNDNKCDFSINKLLLPYVSDTAAKSIGRCPKKPKMGQQKIIDKPYNQPQDLVMDMC